MTVKKVWLTAHDAGLSSLTIESDNSDATKVVRAESRKFPAVPSAGYPERRVTLLALFDHEDLKKIRDAINDHIVRGHHRTT